MNEPIWEPKFAMFWVATAQEQTGNARATHNLPSRHCYRRCHDTIVLTRVAQHRSPQHQGRHQLLSTSIAKDRNVAAGVGATAWCVPIG
jgi:hypothetical protein